MKDKELIEKLVNFMAERCREEHKEYECADECTYRDASVCWQLILTEIVDIIHSAGYVKLADDQTPPAIINNGKSIYLKTDPVWYYKQAQETMIAEGWRKVDSPPKG